MSLLVMERKVITDSIIINAIDSFCIRSHLRKLGCFSINNTHLEMKRLDLWFDFQLLENFSFNQIEIYWFLGSSFKWVKQFNAND